MAQVVDRWHLTKRGADGKPLPSKMYGRGKRWTVRYRDPAGKQRSEAFTRQVDARRRFVEVSSSVQSGTYVDPALSRTLTGTHLDTWLADNEARWKPTTVAKRRQLIRDWYKPAFGTVPLSSLRKSSVQAAVSRWQADHAAGTVAHAVTVLRQALDAAVDDGLVASNPAARVKRSTPKRRRDVYLTDDDVRGILDVASDDDRPFLAYLALAGVRLGEALALEVSDLDLARGTARVWRQVDTSTAERRYLRLKGEDKQGESERTVPIVDALRDEFVALLARRRGSDGAPPTGPVFLSAGGRPLTRGMVDAVVERVGKAATAQAAAAAEPGTKVDPVKFSPHALRHYFGSSLVSRGVPVTRVAAWMGHSNPRTTLQTYSYCMPTDEVTGRAALDLAAATVLSDVHPMCTEASVGE